MLTNTSFRFMKSIYVKSVASFFVMACILSAKADAQTKAPAKETQQKVAVAPSVPQSVILPVIVAQHLESVYHFSQEPGVQIYARNVGAVEVFGFPYLEKLERMILEYVASRPMEPDEYIRFMLPGPIILGDNKKDAMHYEASLKLYFLAHPEVRWSAPSGVLGMFDDPNGYAKLVEIQFNGGNYVGFGARETAPGPAQIKMD